MRDACADSGTGLTEFNGETSHVHLLVNFPPKVARSRLASSRKEVSSRRMKQVSASVWLAAGVVAGYVVGRGEQLMPDRLQLDLGEEQPGRHALDYAPFPDRGGVQPAAAR